MNFLNRTLVCTAILVASIQTSQADRSFSEAGREYEKLPDIELGKV